MLVYEVGALSSFSTVPVCSSTPLHVIEHEIEQFEDDPLEYIRLDLSLTSSSSGSGGLTAEGTTRRQAAADVLRSLVSSGFEEDTTEVAGAWIGKGLQEYSQNTANTDRWKSKDVAIYLLGAVASKGGTTQVRFPCSDEPVFRC